MEKPNHRANRKIIYRHPDMQWIIEEVGSGETHQALSDWELTQFIKVNRNFEMHVNHVIIFLNAFFEKYVFACK